MSSAFPPDPPPLALLAPTGRLRASINLGNPILAGTDPATGAPRGVSVDLARALAERLGVALETIEFPAAAKSVDAVTGGAADVGFFAIDPLRAAEIAFTDAYLLIEGAYLVRDDSPCRVNEDVDRAGTRVVVGQGSAYDLFLTRELKQAVVRARAGRRGGGARPCAPATPTWPAASARCSSRWPGARRGCACCRGASW